MSQPILDDRWFLQPWPNRILLFLVAMALLIPGTATIPLMDRDEPRFAQATWEMMERGGWLIPYFNDEYRFDKPVLSYWWMRLHNTILGKSELASRLHSVVSAWLVAIVIQALGAFLFSRRAGFLAAMAWLTCLQVLIHGRICVADMPMILGITLSMLAICRLLIPEEGEPIQHWKWFWVLAGGQILGFLAKGPIALFVPMLGLFLARFVFYRAPLPWRRLKFFPLLIVVLTGIGLWGIPALIVTNGEFWQIGIGKHVVERGAGALNGRFPVLGYYLVMGFLSLLPWSAFFPTAFSRERSLKTAILLGTFVAPYLIFTPYATQLPHYVLPGFPAFFLLLMRNGEIPTPVNCVPSLNRVFRWTGIGCFVLTPMMSFVLPHFLDPGLHGSKVALVVGLALGGFFFALSRNWFWASIGIVAVPTLTVLGIVLQIDFSADFVAVRKILMAGCGIFLSVSLAAVAYRTKSWVWIGATYVAGIAFVTVFAHQLRAAHPVIAMEQVWGDTSDPDREFRAWTYTEPSLVYYAGQPWEWKSQSKTLPTAVQWLNRKPTTRTAVFLLREWKLDDALKSAVRSGSWLDKPSRDFSEEVMAALGEDLEASRFHVVSGLNIARSSWVEVLLVVPEAN
ncbi:MAG: glycosyltransferase family 39 protein [Verrucomicrobiota bacterium]